MQAVLERSLTVIMSHKKSMNKKRSLSVLFSLISLLVFVQSCTNTETDPSQTENGTPTETTTAPTETNPATETTPAEVAEEPTPEPTPEPVNPLAKFDKEKSAKLTDTSKIMAGFEVDGSSTLADVQNSNAWINNAGYFDNKWPTLENQQLSKVRKWSQAELKTINESNPSIFYPFSGADFLYGYSLFPNAKEYLLIGLEPVGTVPDFQNMSAGERAQKLEIITQSLYAILEYSFFRTLDMEVDLSNQGVLPILLVFMARTNNQILDVQYIGVDANAQMKVVEPGSTESKGLVPGVKISLLPEGESEPKTLYYFSSDISNDGLKKTPGFQKFITQYADESVTYLKAASYLMHYDSFSTIRNLILDGSKALLQDDSGMAVRFVDEAKWDRQFYGQYISPIALFADEYQPDLRSIYQSDATIPPLDFGIGYKFYNDSNLMLATRKSQ